MARLFVWNHAWHFPSRALAGLTPHPNPKGLSTLGRRGRTEARGPALCKRLKPKTTALNPRRMGPDEAGKRTGRAASSSGWRDRETAGLKVKHQVLADQARRDTGPDLFTSEDDAALILVTYSSFVPFRQLKSHLLTLGQAALAINA